MSANQLRRWVSVVLLATAAGLVAAPTPSLAQEARRIKFRRQPSYPELAKRMNVSGVVKIEITITARGDVKNIRVIGGHPLLVNAAEDAVRQWKYEPAPSDTVEIVEFNFNPQGS